MASSGAQVLLDAFSRVRGVVHGVVDGLSPDQLADRLDGSANSITWLVWHLTRIQDDHVADASGSPQVWTQDGWADRFELPLDPADTGYGHGPDEVVLVTVGSGELLTGYHGAVQSRTAAYVATLADADLGRVVDEAWDPPVTLGVRLVSVVSDTMQHAGQAAFLHGVLERRGER